MFVIYLTEIFTNKKNYNIKFINFFEIFALTGFYSKIEALLDNRVMHRIQICLVKIIPTDNLKK